jgi:hypothetical protein
VKLSPGRDHLPVTSPWRRCFSQLPGSSERTVKSKGKKEGILLHPAWLCKIGRKCRIQSFSIGKEEW